MKNLTFYLMRTRYERPINQVVVSRSALALVVLGRQHSHIAPEVSYISMNNIYIYISIFGIIDWLVSLEQLVY